MLLSTDVWVGALIRRAGIGGAHAVVIKRGDDRAGTVLVKVWNPVERRGRLYIEATGMDGEREWIQPVVSESEADLDAYIARQRGYDPDLWAVEIEDREGRHFLTERVAADPVDRG